MFRQKFANLLLYVAQFANLLLSIIAAHLAITVTLSARVRDRHRRGESHERRHSSTRRSIVVRLMPFLCAGACAVRPEDAMTTKGRPQMFMRLSDRYVVSHGRGRVLPHEQGYPTT